MTVVFDSNVLLAAFLTEGVCAKLLFRARRGEFDLIICPFIMREVARVLRRKFRATPAEVQIVLRLILQAAKATVSPSAAPARLCRDPEDDQVLACALAAGAEFLVSGDDDLLSLRRVGSTKIITPRDFEAGFSN